MSTFKQAFDPRFFTIVEPTPLQLSLNALALASATAFVEAEHPRDEKGRFADKTTEIPYKFDLDALWWGKKYHEDFDDNNLLIDNWNNDSSEIRSYELEVDGKQGLEITGFKHSGRATKEEMQNVVDDWTKFLDSAPTWNGPKDGPLYRGIILPANKVKDWTTIDNVVTIHSSQSSSTKSSVAQGFTANDTLLIIKNSTTAVPMWAALASDHEYRSDYEFILRKGSKYRIVNVETKVPTFLSTMERIITLEEIKHAT